MPGIRTRLVLVLLFSTSVVRGGDQDPSYVMTVGSGAGVPGGQAVISTHLDDPRGDPLSGWALGVCHDGPVDALEVGLGSTTATVNDGNPPDFAAAVIFPGEGWAVGVIVSLFGTASLPPASGHELHVTTYELLSEGTVELDLCDTLGDPPILTVVVDEAGTSHSPTRVSGILEIVEAVDVPFVRGDCNGTGSLNIADVFVILEELFRGGPGGPCAEACNVNDDPVYDSTDAIHLLRYLFLMAPPPPAPFPTCGVESGADCDASEGC